jgi:Ca2+-binding EF-hand superfamily protein
MPSKKLLFTAGALVVAIGTTAAVAQGFRGDGEGWSGHRGFMGWRHHGWRDWDGGIKKSEFDEQTRTRFAKIDANSDKVIDAAEAKAMITARRKKRAEGRRRQGSDRRLQRLLNRFDRNRNKKIERDEFDREIGFYFGRLDLNGDGMITDQDLPPILRGQDVLKGDHVGRRGQRMPRFGRFLVRLRGADANNDGEITRAEVDAAAGKMFDRFDRNKDGSIEKADFEVLKQEMIAYHVQRFFHRYGAKDGKLTLAQYTAERDRWFARWDADGDKVLSGDEMPRGFHRHGRRHAWHHGRERDGWREHGRWGRGWHHNRMHRERPDGPDRDHERSDDRPDGPPPPNERQL